MSEQGRNSEHNLQPKQNSIESKYASQDAYFQKEERSKTDSIYWLILVDTRVCSKMQDKIQQLGCTGDADDVINQ